MIWKALLAYLPAMGMQGHDKRVHDFKNIVARDLAAVELKMRQSRRLSHKAADPEAVRQKLEEAGKIYEEARRMLNSAPDDDDGDLLRRADAP